MDVTLLLEKLGEQTAKESEEKKKLVYGENHPFLFREFKLNLILFFFTAFLLWGVLSGVI